jgi:FlaA1/EpsC-like NDP-sugar epimerase/lipopolysaccharide/colanic/teichoic acid biosynthesis glycosyltransferase
MKRAVDCLAAAVGLLLLSPLLALIAVSIKAESRGPVFFRQTRVGRGFRPFLIFKFRTMRVDAEQFGPLVTAAGDDRVTRVGHWLRLTKLDELPQLINVLAGDMSLVGPRPEVSRYVELFRADYADILAVRPGITDLASLKYRHEAEILARARDREAAYISEVLPDKIRLAKIYVKHASPIYDAKVLLGTMLSLFERSPRHEAPRPAGGGGAGPAVAWLLAHRRAIVVAVHLALIVLANYAAFWLRFDGAIPAPMLALLVRYLPALVLIRGLTFVPFRLYEGLWRYTSIWDLQRIIVGVCGSSLLFFLLVHVALGDTGYPRSIFVMDAVLLVCAMTGVRLAQRVYAEVVRAPRDRRVLIYGAGDAGEMVVRDMLRHPESDYEPVGFIDDDPSKIGRRIHGVLVLGSRADLPRLVAWHQPSEILVALPAASKAAIRRVVGVLAPFKVPITTVPNLSDIRNGRVTIEQIRRLQVEDLLERRPGGIDLAPLRELVEGACVMVTGAGGSIGSELSRQIAALRPAALLLFERYENSLHQIATDLHDRCPGLGVIALIGDVTDRARLDFVLSMHRPSIVFHAAAHKHVPLMELNPCEAIKNNVMGTRMVAEAALAHGVGRFVLISSDKAVNPSSVMGATKRVAELVTRSLNGRGVTRFITVRFGNVLGSNGSVVPRFVEQIQAGGPVTVTHPDMRRYFMLIPEAVQLVLHAAAIDEGGGIYVFEMGEQIRLVDLARNLIRLSGHVPDEEIAIEYTGLRPGEKLFEELIGNDESAEAASVPNLVRIRWQPTLGMEHLGTAVRQLESIALDGRPADTIRQLCVLVPTFRPDQAVHVIDTAAPVGPDAQPGRAERRRLPYGDRREVRRGGRRWYDAMPIPHATVTATVNSVS